jgi:hypothetical protein
MTDGMPDVGTPSSPLPTHTSTQEWQSFEMRMRRRRAGRCLLRAEIALDAGFEEEAREALDEARRLDWQSPDFESLQARVAQRHAAEAAERNGRRHRVYAIVAALALTTTAGAGAWLLQRETAGPAPAIEIAVPPQAPAPAAPVEEPPPVPVTTPTVVAEQQLITAEAVAPPMVPDERPAAPVRNERKEEPADRPPALANVKASPTLLEALNRNIQRTPPVLDVAVPTSSTPAPQPAQGAVGSLGKSVAETPVAMPETTRVPELPTAPVTPPPAPRTAPAPTPAPPDDSGVRAVLARYESAYSTLNASAARAVWPGAPGSLQRAFDALESQQVSLGPCSITMNGALARATCPGQTSWTPKVGGGTRSASRRWSFDLANAGGAWKITRVDVR